MGDAVSKPQTVPLERFLRPSSEAGNARRATTGCLPGQRSSACIHAYRLFSRTEAKRNYANCQ